MNLLRKLYKNHVDAKDLITAGPEFGQGNEQKIQLEPADQVTSQNNVIPLPSPEVLISKPIDAPQTIKQISVKGLIGADLIKAFFDQNHFGLGRHNGANFRTQDAMEFGRASRIAEFRNAVRGTVEHVQAKVDRLASTQIEADGVCKATSARLVLAINQLERDLKTLSEQSELASEGKGWVLEALNRYQAGFVKGVREAVEAELILG